MQFHDDVHARIDELFDRDRAVFGDDLAPYTGHAHRVAEMAARQVTMIPQWVEPVAVACYRALHRTWPDHGFHAMLGRGFLQGLREGNPAPMIKL